MFEKLYDNYLNMQKSMLSLQILIYSCLTLSFSYSLYQSINFYLNYKSLQIIPLAVSIILILVFVPQLILMILVKLNIDPFYEDPAKKKKKIKKKKKKKRFKNNDIVEFRTKEQ